MTTENKSRVVVCGDVAIDWIDSPIPPVTRGAAGGGAGEDFRNWRLRPGTRRVDVKGGAWMLADIVRETLEDCAVVHGPPTNPLGWTGPDSCVQSYLRVAGFGKEPPEGCRRVIEYCGFDGPQDPQAKLDALYGDSMRDIAGPVDLLIVDDAANGLRTSTSIADRLCSFIGSTTKAVVYKMSRPLDGSMSTINQPPCPLWNRIVQACSKQSGAVLVAVLDANDLRAECAQISRGLSWERSSWEIMRHFRNINDQLHNAGDDEARLALSCWIVVRMGLEAALILPPEWSIPHDDSPADSPRAFLVYDPVRAEDDYNRDFDGSMVGFSSVFAAGLACSFLRSPCSDNECSARIDRLARGAALGLSGARELLSRGFQGRDAARMYPVGAVGAVLRSSEPSANIHSVAVPPLEGDFGPAEECWSIVSTRKLAAIEQIARSIVESGLEHGAESIPVARFGEFCAVTLSEIESYRSIQRLIREYSEAGVQDRPLCIAVFGRPGSGKSFGVKQVVRHILGADTKALTFNLSEFRDITELSRAFHLIHNQTRDGAVPLVFFDEFDCSFGKGDEYGWLKYFLAPMQDGVFNDGADIHPVGRAIFVFAGGTRQSYNEFAGQATRKEFINAKGPDFLSRLRGSIDIIGAEPTGLKDYACLLRRAVMLRVCLEERARKTLGNKAYWLLAADGKINIDSGVLRAFLKVPFYRNGVRSMTAIIETSELSTSRGFTRAALPPDALLNMHADASAFRYLAMLPNLQEPLFLPSREELAQLVHAQYCNRHPDSDTNVPWSELAEDIREQNRLQIDRYLRHLSAIGCTVELAGLPGITPYDLTQADIDALAKFEHERWYRDKKAQKWRHGEQKDPEKRTHPDLRPWEHLPPDVQRKDVEAMSDIPKLLERVGLCVVRP